MPSRRDGWRFGDLWWRDPERRKCLYQRRWVCLWIGGETEATLAEAVDGFPRRVAEAEKNGVLGIKSKAFASAAQPSSTYLRSFGADSVSLKDVDW